MAGQPSRALHVGEDELEPGTAKAGTKSFKAWLTIDQLYWLDQQVITRKATGNDIDDVTGQRINVNRSTILRDIIDDLMANEKGA